MKNEYLLLENSYFSEYIIQEHVLFLDYFQNVIYHVDEIFLNRFYSSLQHASSCTDYFYQKMNMIVYRLVNDNFLNDNCWH